MLRRVLDAATRSKAVAVACIETHGILTRARSVEHSCLPSGVLAASLFTGQAWGDYDGDGLVDLYLTDSAGPNTLFRNIGNGRFEVSPLNADVALPAHVSGGATFADYDNDGRDDLLVLRPGNQFHALTFRDNVVEVLPTSIWSLSAAMGSVR